MSREECAIIDAQRFIRAEKDAQTAEQSISYTRSYSQSRLLT